MLILPELVPVEQNVNSCPGVTAKYSPVNVAAGRKRPPGAVVTMEAEVIPVALVVWSILAQPAIVDSTRICWVPLLNAAEHFNTGGAARIRF